MIGFGNHLLHPNLLTVNDNDERVDEVLMEALAECYRSASNWRTRRQILSIMADKVSYKALKWIPNLTRYRFSEAGKHILIEGRGVALSPQSSQTRMEPLYPRLN